MYVYVRTCGNVVFYDFFPPIHNVITATHCCHASFSPIATIHRRHPQRRLGSGRRCFAFLHPCMPEEPLVFIHAALLSGMADSLPTIRDNTGLGTESEEEARCAIFYTISATQPGLQGVELGNFLIKRVVGSLIDDFPNLETFATLSPIPGFMQWLRSTALRSPGDVSEIMTEDDAEMIETTWEFDTERSRDEDGDGGGGGDGDISPLPESMLIALLDRDEGGGEPWYLCPATSENMRAPLMRLGAHYLSRERRKGCVETLCLYVFKSWGSYAHP